MVVAVATAAVARRRTFTRSLLKSYANGMHRGSLSPPICLAKFCHSLVDFDGRFGQKRTDAKRMIEVGCGGNIGFPFWVTSGAAIFRESESNVT